MRYYIIAGEASGDLHGSNLLKAIQKTDPAAHFRCWGGDMMQAAGGQLVKHYRELAFMGFTEVIMNLRTIFRNLSFCKSDIADYHPDAIILIDYPGFNLRIAEWAKKEGFTIIYYISPQVWAWKENRVKKMKISIDLMLVILPFEKDYYKNKWQWEVTYVGHPLVEVIDEYEATEVRKELGVGSRELGGEGRENTIIALLPGSRKQEILKKLPVMLEISKDFPAYQFMVAKAPGVEDSFYAPLLAPYPNVSSVNQKTYALLSKARAALVTSGTATLETALFGVPEVVCYKGSSISYQIAKRIINIKYISLVNLIMDKEVVKELIQDEMNRKNLQYELNLLLSDQKKQEQIAADYRDLRTLLSQGGHASDNAAKKIKEFLKG